MDRICFLAVFLCIFVVADVSDASSSLSKHRILIGEPQNNDTTVPGKVEEDSPVPNPQLPLPVSSSGGNGSDTKPVDDPSKDKVESPKPKVDQGPKGGLNNDAKKGEGKDPETKKKDPETEKKDPEPVKTLKDDPKPDADKVLKDDPKPDTDKVSKDDPKPDAFKVLKDDPKPDTDKVSKNNPKPDTDKSKDGNVTHSTDEGGKKKSKEKEKEKKNDDVTQLPNEDKESCEGVIKTKTCEVKDVAVACIKSVDSGSKGVTILVLNVGDSTLKARLSADDTNKDLKIFKHQNKMVNISIDMGKSTKITLNAGNGECELHLDPLPLASEGNLFMRFPSLETVATPINGAYFLIVTVLIFGGTWACCLIRKRKERTGGGVPYQELEMGLPESVSASAVETAEGWDEGWDDDWDGDNAVKTPGAHLGSISANGLTSRAANKDGWDNDWDD